MLCRNLGLLGLHAQVNGRQDVFWATLHLFVISVSSTTSWSRTIRETLVITRSGCTMYVFTLAYIARVGLGGQADCVFECHCLGCHGEL